MPGIDYTAGMIDSHQDHDKAAHPVEGGETASARGRVHNERMKYKDTGLDFRCVISFYCLGLDKTTFFLTSAVVLMLRYLPASSKPWANTMRTIHIFHLEIMIRADVVGFVHVPRPGT